MTQSRIRQRSAYACTMMLGAAMLSGEAQAQDRTPAATGSSERAAFQVQGLPAGAFRIYPTLRITTSYDDNVSFSDTDKVGDAIITVAPSIDARSQWTRHELTGGAFLRANRYFKRDEQNNEEYGGRLNGRLDVLRTFSISANAGYSHLVELRGTPGDLFTSRRYVEYDIATASLQVRKRFNRIGISAGVGATNFRYDDLTLDGVEIDQDFRNRNVRSANARIDYQYSSTTSFFLTGTVNRSRYRQIGPTGLDRGSHGYSALAGVQFELTQLLRGEVGIGYISQTFRDPRYSDFSGLNYSVNLTYAPTALTSVTLTGSRELTDSAVFQVGGVLASRIALSVEHELLRNLLVSADADYIHYKYRGLDRTDNRYGFGVGARYKFNRFVSAALSFDHIRQDANVLLGREYKSNRVSLSLILAR